MAFADLLPVVFEEFAAVVVLAAEALATACFTTDTLAGAAEGALRDGTVAERLAG